MRPDHKDPAGFSFSAAEVVNSVVSMPRPVMARPTMRHLDTFF